MCLKYLLLVLSFTVGLAAQADTMVATVIAVSDGDTITVLDAARDQHKIRLGSIDAPEKYQPFGERAKQFLSILLAGKEVDVHWTKRDRYGRIIGKVMIAAANCRTVRCPKTMDAGLEQVAVGLAWWYRKCAKEQEAEDAGRYESAELAARARHAGLWAEAHPVPPWEWRDARRQAQKIGP